MIIDVHAHLSPPQAARRFPMPPSLTDVDAMLAARADAGIDLTVIGSPVGAGAMMRVPGVDNYAQPTDRLRAFHDWMASVVETFPDRLRAYVYVNPLGSDEHLAAAAETLENPAFVGFIVNSSVRGRFLDSPAADGFFALAAERGAPVLVHAPAEPVGADAVEDLRFVEHVTRFADVASGLAMIVLAGWLAKYPRLALIGATGGGAVAALAGKLDLAGRPRPGAGPAATACPAGPPPAPGRDLRRLHVDTAALSGPLLSLNVDVLGADHVLLGTDHPPLAVPPAAAVAAVRALPLDRAGQEAILGGNAARLFGLPGTSPARTPPAAVVAMQGPMTDAAPLDGPPARAGSNR